jgi:hypothetical protein
MFVSWWREWRPFRLAAVLFQDFHTLRNFCRHQSLSIGFQQCHHGCALIRRELAFSDGLQDRLGGLGQVGRPLRIFGSLNCSGRDLRADNTLSIHKRKAAESPFMAMNRHFLLTATPSACGKSARAV